MKRSLFAIFLTMAVLLNVRVLTYADEANALSQNSNINFKMKEVGGKYIINYENNLIDPDNIDALLLINGKIIPENYVVIKEGYSLIPLRVVSDALGLGLEWHADNGTILLEKNNRKILFTVEAPTAIVDGLEVELDIPAQIINSSIYIPARFIAENMNCAVQFDTNIINLPKSDDNHQGKTNIPIVSIEQNSNTAITPLTQEQAVSMVISQVTTMFTKNYATTKSNEDISLFINEISYKAVSKSMGRFYRIEVHFYDQWSKRFESCAYVDSYTKQIYLGDYQYGLTEDMLPYLINKYERHLTIENKNTKIIPFSEMNIIKDSPIVYVNFPEQIHDNALLETYFNRVDSIRSGRVFLSHKNCANQTIDYMIRFENNTENETALSVVEDKAIHTTEQYQDQVTRAHIKRLYENKQTNQNQEIVLQPGETYDTALINIENEQFFTGIVDFDASNPVSITVFSVNSAARDSEKIYNEIQTPVIPYDYDYDPKTYDILPSEGVLEKNQYYTTYSGLGAGYKIEAKGVLNASEMVRINPTDAPWNIAFETGGSSNNINQRNGLTEIVEINLLEPRGQNNEITKATWHGNTLDKDTLRSESDRFNKDIARNYGNLGNWGIEYNVTVQLNNDTDTDKVFRCDIVPTYQTTWAFIADNNVASTSLNNKLYTDTFNRKDKGSYDEIHIGSGIRSGNVDSIVVKANDTVELSYIYILGTESESTIYHIWTCLDTE